MLTLDEYTALKAKSDRFNQWVDSIRGKSGWASYRDEEIPDEVRPFKVENDDRALLEEYEFVHDPPEKYFTYVRPDKGTVGTWTGTPLGTILHLGRPFKVMGAERRSIRFKGINGRIYAGFYYSGTGDYCRVKQVKA